MRLVEPKLQEWLSWDIDPKTREEIAALAETARKDIAAKKAHSDAANELAERLLKRLQFGTAGLRAAMAAGYNRINQLVVLQTSQGLCRYVEAQFGHKKSQGIAVGYDGRHNSRTYAQIIAAVFTSQGIPVYFFNRIVSTPMVPFAVKQLRCVAGVMVTASHNPKEDNGYKVYWENSAQIIPPHDRGIADAIERSLKPWMKYQFDPSHALLRDPTTKLVNLYMSMIQKACCWEAKANSESKMKVTYTAMHGVGTHFVEGAFKAFSLPAFIPVKEQVEPDPEFPTVKFPNPEEGKGALALAIKTADAAGSRLILANDPDADRLAVAEKDAKSGEWHILNGNQIAALFADWVWTNHIKRNPNCDRSKCVMLASTVSSKFLQGMAEKEGFSFKDTLTGFKWMGNAIHDLEREGYTFLFAYEVEIGFLVGNMSLDKDGVRTAAVFAEMANQLALRKTTCWEHLQSLYAKYGYYEMNTSYFFAYTTEPLERVFSYLRVGNKGGYVEKCGPYKVTSVRDITTGYDSSTPDKKTTLPQMSDSHMITFHFDNGCVATLRNSGTEPKLKYYVEAKHPTSQQGARAKVDEMTEYIIKEFMQPERNGLIARKQG